MQFQTLAPEFPKHSGANVISSQWVGQWTGPTGTNPKKAFVARASQVTSFQEGSQVTLTRPITFEFSEYVFASYYESRDEAHPFLAWSVSGAFDSELRLRDEIFLGNLENWTPPKLVDKPALVAITYDTEDGAATEDAHGGQHPEELDKLDQDAEEAPLHQGGEPRAIRHGAWR